MDTKALDALLKRNGFAPDLVAADSEDAKYQQLSVIVATANVSPETKVQGREITILEASSPSHTSQALATQLAFELENHSFRIKRLRWNATVSELREKTCVSLMELDKPFLEDLNNEDFAVIKQLILHTSSLLWITALDDPTGGLASGMARSIRNEIPGIQFRTLSVQTSSLDSPDRLAPLIGKLAMTSTSDDEFLEKDGVLQICRVVEDAPMNKELSRWLAEGKDKIDFVPLGQVNCAQKLAIKAQGMLDTLCLESDEDATGDIGNDEVEIKVKATGLK